MKVRFGIVAMFRGEMVHFCGYENKPTADDARSLREELATDPEFGLVGEMAGVTLYAATPEMVAHFTEAAKV